MAIFSKSSTRVILPSTGFGRIEQGGVIIASVTYQPRIGVVSVERNGALSDIRGADFGASSLAEAREVVRAHCGIAS
jgi:hypothetical protein